MVTTWIVADGTNCFNVRSLCAKIEMDFGVWTRTEQRGDSRFDTRGPHGGFRPLITLR